MTTGRETGLQRWLAFVERKDPSALPALVAEQAVFRSPAVHAPQPGRALVVGYLSAAMLVIGPTLRYHRTWQRDTGAILEFSATVGDREVQGVDIIEWDETGLIVDFTVMIRPLSALHAVITEMAARLSPPS
ncbi:MAG: nuclear transport factor 2 family protein [Nocardioides sp.]